MITTPPPSSSWSPVGATLVLLGLVAGGCSNAGPTVYTGQAYDPQADCLEPYQSIALIESDNLPGDCDPACLDINGTVYVSMACAPYPPLATPLSQDDPTCAKALAAPPCD